MEITFTVAIIIVIVIVISIYFYNYNEDTVIDAVITFVDGDSSFHKEQIKNILSNSTETINSRKNFRWKNNGEAKFLIECINKHCSFFRQIFFVVADETHIPIWLSNTLSKIPIKIVFHRDFYKHVYHLPTFNSMSIESNLFRINGLSEYFVYFNDDCFVTQRLSKRDFITSELKIIIQPDSIISQRGTPVKTEPGFISAWKNTNRILDEITKSETTQRQIIKHVPQIQKKSIHKELSKLIEKEFENTSQSKFRNTENNLTSAGLSEYYSLFKEEAVIKQNTDDYIQVFISDDKIRNEKIFDFLIKNKMKYKFVNIQNNCNNEEGDYSLFLQEFLK